MGMQTHQIGSYGRAFNLFASVLLAAGLLISATAQAAGPVTDQTVAQAIKEAKTAQDHTDLATYFRAQAVAAGETVKKHEAMAEAWKSSGKSAASMKQHCEHLIKSSRDLQKGYEAMAAEEEKKAKASGK
jgi:hypothetical protein